MPKKKTPAPVVEPTETEPTLPIAQKTKLPQQNGVTRPAAGTRTARVWEITDELSEEAGKPARRKDVIEKGISEGLNASTIATQYGRWRKFHGLKGSDEQAAEA